MRLLLGAPQVQHILRHVRKRRIKIDLSPGGFETTTGSQLVRCRNTEINDSNSAGFETLIRRTGKCLVPHSPKISSSSETFDAGVFGVEAGVFCAATAGWPVADFNGLGTKSAGSS
jgi:hypothetical protein